MDTVNRNQSDSDVSEETAEGQEANGLHDYSSIEYLKAKKVSEWDKEDKIIFSKWVALHKKPGGQRNRMVHACCAEFNVPIVQFNSWRPLVSRSIHEETHAQVVHLTLSTIADTTADNVEGVIAAPDDFSQLTGPSDEWDAEKRKLFLRYVTSEIAKGGTPRIPGGHTERCCREKGVSKWQFNYWKRFYGSSFKSNRQVSFKNKSANSETPDLTSLEQLNVLARNNMEKIFRFTEDLWRETAAPKKPELGTLKISAYHFVNVAADTYKGDAENFWEVAQLRLKRHVMNQLGIEDYDVPEAARELKNSAVKIAKTHIKYLKKQKPTPNVLQQRARFAKWAFGEEKNADDFITSAAEAAEIFLRESLLSVLEFEKVFPNLKREEILQHVMEATVEAIWFFDPKPEADIDAFIGSQVNARLNVANRMARK